MQPFRGWESSSLARNSQGLRTNEAWKWSGFASGSTLLGWLRAPDHAVSSAGGHYGKYSGALLRELCPLEKLTRCFVVNHVSQFETVWVWSQAGRHVGNSKGKSMQT